MENAIIFGAGQTAKFFYSQINNQYKVVAFADNDENLWGSKLYDINIISPNEIHHQEYDVIIIACLMGFEEIKYQLEELGIKSYKIITNYVSLPFEGRIAFLEKFASEVYEENIGGNVAEVGVYKGAFATHINRCFPDRKLYLFDTFEGFDVKDILIEQALNLSGASENYFKNDNIDIVMSKLLHKNAGIEIKKGYFPETATNINDRFCFVNLDLDLYQPTYDGLALFYPKLVDKGIILIHDYFSFSMEWNGVKKAVKDFEQTMGMRLHKLPIGDKMSIAIIK